MSEDRVAYETLSRRQQNAIPALLNNISLRSASKELKIHEKTLYKWLHTPQFQTVYRQARRLVMEEAFDKVQKLCSEAVEVLADIMRDSTASPFVRVNAATAILETALKSRTLEDLEARIAELERADVARHDGTPQAA